MWLYFRNVKLILKAIISKNAPKVSFEHLYYNKLLLNINFKVFPEGRFNRICFFQIPRHSFIFKAQI